MTYLTIIQRNILVVALIIIFSILIYVLWQLIKKESERAAITKFMILDNVITYKQICDLIKYRIHHKKDNIYFSLMMITIDNFDQILDYVDSKSTTEYIQRVAKLLEMTLPLGAKLAQTEERETFIIYLPELYNQERFLEIGQQFKNMVERRIELNQGSFIEKSASVALITYPNQADSLNGLIEALFTTIYSIKRKGGGHVLFYSVDMIEEKDNFDQYQNLRSAIKKQDIKMLFTPIYQRTLLAMSGVETEIIWQKQNEVEHFKHFMPNLEASHDMYWFGLWMLEKALSSYMTFEVMNHSQPLSIYLPVGVRQFENEFVSRDMIQILEKYQVSPEQLILKIINPLQVNQEARFIQSLIELQAVGIKLAIEINKIDENLYYLLNEYKIDVILIHEQLLTKTHDKVIEVEELLTFARSHQIDLVATTIKQKDQVLKLDEHVEKIQGPCLSAPLTKEQVLNQMNKKLDIQK